MQDSLTVTVADMSCDHCKTAITERVGSLPGVESVEVDLATKRVEVRGEDVAEPAVIAAIDDAGYEAVPA